MPGIDEAAIMAGGALLGGALGARSQASANRANLRFQRNYISYRVADAKRAGIHPLYALGGSTAPGATIRSLGDFGVSAAAERYGTAMGNARAERQALARNRELDDLQRRLTEANIQRTDMETARIAAEIGAIRSNNPATVPKPVPGVTGNTPAVILDEDGNVVSRFDRATKAQEYEDYEGDFSGLYYGTKNWIRRKSRDFGDWLYENDPFQLRLKNRNRYRKKRAPRMNRNNRNWNY